MSDPGHNRASVETRALATVIGGSAWVEPRADQIYRLSRFAYVRRDGDDLVLESPLTPARVVLHDWRALAGVYALRRPQRVSDLAAAVSDLDASAATGLVGTLVGAGMLSSVGPDGTSEDVTGSLQTWEFHDLLFHAWSRAGRNDRPAGGTYRFAGIVEPPPALVPSSARASIPLEVPDLDRLQEDDKPLAWVMEARSSLRDYGPDPISKPELSEFLYRVARVADYWEREARTPSGSVSMDFAPRPYPSGGALYELDLCVAVGACRDIEPGLYRYAPEHHRLDRVSVRAPLVEELLADGGRAAGIRPETVQVLVIVSARFARIAWKYESIAYSLLLKNVGVLYEAMYLVATAMGLAPCALGRGNSDLFAKVAGTDYYAETSVGEFLLGSRPDAWAT